MTPLVHMNGNITGGRLSFRDARLHVIRATRHAIDDLMYVHYWLHV